jgi:mannitol-1-phosphate 5-dehydrogenase
VRKALVFGAGNIGRGFLGVLLRQSDFEVRFVDINADHVNLINRHREYPVFVCSSTGVTEQTVSDVSALHFSDEDHLIKAVCDSDIVMTAVGRNALQHVAQPIAKGLYERHRRGGQTHLVVVACENVRDNTTYLADFVHQVMGDENWDVIRDSVSFPNCIVDRIVPNTKPDSDHPLATIVEDYFQFVVDENQLQEAFPDVTGVDVVPNVSAKLDQKLFTLNMAHGIVGYYGVFRGHHYVHEAITDPDILELVMGALGEVEDVVTKTHPTISKDNQSAYARRIVERFRNPHLKDELTRVVSQPKRKLGRDERLVLPARILVEQGGLPAHLATGIASGFHFRNDRDSQAMELASAITSRGIGVVMSDVAGLELTHPLSQMVKADFLLRAL